MTLYSPILKFNWSRVHYWQTYMVKEWCLDKSVPILNIFWSAFFVVIIDTFHTRQSLCGVVDTVVDCDNVVSGFELGTPLSFPAPG